jgi:hypothetical protein
VPFVLWVVSVAAAGQVSHGIIAVGQMTVGVVVIGQLGIINSLFANFV